MQQINTITLKNIPLATYIKLVWNLASKDIFRIDVLVIHFLGIRRKFTIYSSTQGSVKEVLNTLFFSIDIL